MSTPGDAAEKTCPRCGYVFEPWDSACPRCARRAETSCAVCGRKGVVAECSRCEKEVCGACLIAGDQPVCRTCSLQQEEILQSAVPDEISSTGYEVGFLPSVSRAFRFIGATIATAFRDPDLLIPPILSVILSAGVVALTIWALIVRAGGVHEFSHQRRDYVEWAVLVAVAFVLYLVAYFFGGMTVHLVDAHIHARNARIGKALADALKNLHAILWLAIAATAVSAFTAMLRGSRRGRGLEDYAADAIDKVWQVASFLFLPIIIIEDVPLRKAIERARQIHADNLLGIGVGEVGVIIVTRVISFGALVAVAGGAYFLFASGAGLAVVLGLAGIIIAVVAAFQSYIRTAYYTCLYLWAAAREKAEKPVAAPAPLAHALGARPA
jgi:hypothetical protein